MDMEYGVWSLESGVIALLLSLLLLCGCSGCSNLTRYGKVVRKMMVDHKPHRPSDAKRRQFTPSLQASSADFLRNKLGGLESRCSHI